MKAAANATGAKTASVVNFRIARSLRPNAYEEKMPIPVGEIQNLNSYDLEIAVASYV
jgi:hypothetical protein